jgi:hypothetical protein
MKAMLRITLPMAGLVALALLLPQSTPAREEGADGNFSRRRSSHFVLYQDVAIDQYSGPRGSRRFEQDVLEVLEDAHDRVARVLGVRPVRPVEVVVYDAAVFEAEFASLFGFRAAGFYHGVIRLQAGTRLSTELVRTLQHEYVHAALDAAAGSVALPAWLNEGLAEYFEALAIGKRRLSRGELILLVEARSRGSLPSLEALQGHSFARLSPPQASMAYLKSYAAIEHLVRRYGERQLQRFVAQLLRTGKLERAFERTYRKTPAQLDLDLDAELS